MQQGCLICAASTPRFILIPKASSWLRLSSFTLLHCCRRDGAPRLGRCPVRERNAWIIGLGLVLTLVLICGSARNCIAIPLPIAMLIGLGIPAILLLWENREKLTEIFGSRR